MPRACRATSTATARAFSDPFSNNTSAAAWAMAAPWVIAQETEAAARTGASLIPSPTISTLWPLFCFCSMNSSLSCGVIRAWYSVMPRPAATVLTASGVSPLAMMMFSPR
jgi:hypothetical protein